MAAPTARRPLPALVFLLGLSLLTALVWWRVIHRSDSHPTSSGTPTTCAAKPTPTLLPQPSSVSLQVLNSTATVGLAAKTKTALTSLGFVVASVGNDDSGVIPGVAEIRYGPTGAAAASLVSYYLPGATLVPRSDQTTAQVIVSLGQKFTTPATAAVAKAAMSAAHVSQAPATTPPATSTTPTPTAPTTAPKTTSAGSTASASC